MEITCVYIIGLIGMINNMDRNKYNELLEDYWNYEMPEEDKNGIANGDMYGLTLHEKLLIFDKMVKKNLVYSYEDMCKGLGTYKYNLTDCEYTDIRKNKV